MRTDPKELERVYTGSFTQVEFMHDLLENAGIESSVVGDNLASGLGTALPDSVELWVHRADAEAAKAAMIGTGGHHHRVPESHPTQPQGHPVSDHKPDHSRGPQHGAPPHRPLPS
jgi:hypothetical protein